MHYLFTLMIQFVTPHSLLMSADSRNCCADKKCKGLVFYLLIHFSHREPSIEFGDLTLKLQEFKSGFQSYAENSLFQH